MWGESNVRYEYVLWAEKQLITMGAVFSVDSSLCQSNLTKNKAFTSHSRGG